MSAGRIRRDPALLAACGFGSGLAPAAPGTAGSAAALLLWLPLSALPPAAYLAAVGAAFALGVWLCGLAARELGEADPPAVVWDEFVGLWIALFMAPPGWRWTAAGFAAFRLLDILKPWPIKQVERRWRGGAGIMLDDAAAGIMTALLLQALAALAPPP